MIKALSHYSRLEYCAVLLALLLSTSCVARGLVDDKFIVLILISMIPLTWFSLGSNYEVHPLFLKLLLAIISLFSLVTISHWLFLESIDITAWKASVGRLVFLSMVGIIALQIGTSGGASRMFFLSLLFCSIIAVCISFYWYRTDKLMRVSDYSHGLVNPNNAASYLGLMLIISIVQINSFIRHHVKWVGSSIPVRLENLKFTSLIKILFMLFGFILFLVGLFLTNSRGGVILSLAVCLPLILWLTLKTRMNVNMGKRLLSLLFAATASVLLVFWVFNQYGSGLTKDILSQGLSGDARPDLFAAIIPMIIDQPILGHGLGGFASQFQSYRSDVLPVEGLYDKAHNSYLEVTAEMGIPILLALLFVISIMVKHFIIGVKKRKKRYGKPSMGLAIIALIGLHSLVDFPLQIPAIFALVISILIINVVQTDRNYVLSKCKRRSKAKLVAS